MSHAAETRWKLVWQDDFNRPGFIDPAKWVKIERGQSDWNRHMSSDPSLYAVKNGHLILKGIVNPDPGDKVPYLTGGLTTKGRFQFTYGKVEIRAKLGCAKGAWPAFWMLSDSRVYGGYPHSGEIDIMEHLNFDKQIHQTIHSNYTLNLGGKENPPHHGVAKVDPSSFHVYGLEWYADKLVFTLDGKATFTYPKKEVGKPGQWPFDQPFYLLIDMQLGGNWVGPVDASKLPVQMEIDWVRVSSEERSATKRLESKP